jgi:exodeoxyribonuclease VII large subunit
MDVWTVGDMTRYIREMFDLDDELQDVWVEGEVSNLTQARSGHLYFTLKDAEAQLKCVMWRWEAAALPFIPQHGDAVRAHGRVSVYEAGGAYQLYTDWLKPVGRGDLHRQFEELKSRLEAEGLFEPERKKPIPVFPRRIGVVTSADAAAWRDVLNVLSRRFPLVEVLLAPTLVQGAEAPSQIVRALAELDGRDDVDLIILTRGGGSLEDLWAFNDEMVARAVAGCRHPVISGVGHETDFTIADFAADLRAPTPSAAAELATPDVQELAAKLATLQRSLVGALAGRLELTRWRLDAATRALRVLSPSGRLLNLTQRLDELQSRVDRAMVGWLRMRRQRLASLERALMTVNPLATLARGYAIVSRADLGLVVTDPAQVAAGDRLQVQVRRGRFEAEVVDRA